MREQAPRLARSLGTCALISRYLVARAALQTTAQIFGKVSLATTAVDTTEQAAVYSQCFDGIGLRTCTPTAPTQQDDVLPNYLAVREGSPWCLDCCGRGDSTYLWPVKCALTPATAVSVNLYSSEFRIARMQTLTDTSVLRCSIRRSQCSYDNEGILTSCAKQTLYLAGYTLTLTIKEHYKPFAYWNEVLACDVSSNETTYKPSEFHETVVMNYSIPDTSYTDKFTFLIILVGSAAFAFICLRFIRREQCIVCGKRLMFTCFRCAYCRFYGAEAPCPEMLAELETKSFVQYGTPPEFSFSSVFLQTAKGYSLPKRKVMQRPINSSSRMNVQDAKMSAVVSSSYPTLMRDTEPKNEINQFHPLTMQNSLSEGFSSRKTSILQALSGALQNFAARRNSYPASSPLESNIPHSSEPEMRREGSTEKHSIIMAANPFLVTGAKKVAPFER